jgi:PAS domain S-box-containing protein
MTENLDQAAGDGDAEHELNALRGHIAYLEEVLTAISSGGVDAVVMGSGDQERVYTLTSADLPYRVLVESMGEGAVTVSEGGVVLYANAQLATFLGVARDSMIGRDLVDYLDESQQQALDDLLVSPAEGGTRRSELSLIASTGSMIPFLVAATDLDLEDVRVRCLVLTDLTMQKEMEQQMAQRAADNERDHLVREVNDTIVQGLVTAEMALDLDDADYARSVIARTSLEARKWIGQLAQGHQLLPGMAVRRRPASSSEPLP